MPNPVIGYVVIDWGHALGKPYAVYGLIEKDKDSTLDIAAAFNLGCGGMVEPNRYTVADVREIEADHE